MKDKRSILKASGVDDLFAKMEEACRVPCEITLEVQRLQIVEVAQGCRDTPRQLVVGEIQRVQIGEYA